MTVLLMLGYSYNRRLRPLGGSRAWVLAVGLSSVLSATGCFNRPVGVDYSADPDYAFGQIHRVAIVEPPGRPSITGLAGVLVDTAAEALAQRYHVYYGNGLLRLVATAGVNSDFERLRAEFMAGHDVDAALIAKVGKAIGVDAFFYEAIASLRQQVETGPTYSTVQVNRGYGTITQNPSSAVVTTVRLGARLYDSASGMVVWSASKIAATTDNLAYSGFTPLFTSINRNFVMTIPVGAASPAPVSLAPRSGRTAGRILPHIHDAAAVASGRQAS